MGPSQRDANDSASAPTALISHATVRSQNRAGKRWLLRCHAAFSDARALWIRGRQNHRIPAFLVTGRGVWETGVTARRGGQNEVDMLSRCNEQKGGEGTWRVIIHGI